MFTIHRFNKSLPKPSWGNIDPFIYDLPELKGVHKYLLVGPGDKAKNFELRYFLFELGSRSDLTRHDKEYAFFILHGKAHLQINNEFFDLKPQDVVYVSQG